MLVARNLPVEHRIRIPCTLTRRSKSMPTGITISTKITTGYHEKTKSRSQRLNSEEDILPSRHEQPDGITRKTDFTIAYHRSSEGSLSSLLDEHSAEAHI